MGSSNGYSLLLLHASITAVYFVAEVLRSGNSPDRLKGVANSFCIGSDLLEHNSLSIFRVVVIGRRNGGEKSKVRLYFARKILGKEGLKANLFDSADALRIAEAIWKSSQDKKPVIIKIDCCR